MQLAIVGYRVLVKPDKVEDTFGKGSKIVRPDSDKKVLQLGLDAYAEHKAPWCDAGDRVFYQRHAGMKIPDGKGGFREDMLVLNDVDIVARIIEEDHEE
jgi:co-chaperonin GroES (HSP10)